MSDAAVRELERLASAGDRDAQARLLVAWARAGEPACKTPHRLMTLDERAMAAALDACSFSPGSFDKKFARAVGAQGRALAPWITAKQARLLREKVITYRRQITADVLELAHALWRETIGPRCATCQEPQAAHASWCAAHPDEAARREREALGMFAPPEGGS